MTETRSRWAPPEVATLILVLMVAAFAFTMAGCALFEEGAYERNIRLQDAELKAKWTDTNGVSHVDHTVRFITRVYSDSTYKTLVAIRWQCLDDKAIIEVPEPPFRLAR